MEAVVVVVVRAKSACVPDLIAGIVLARSWAEGTLPNEGSATSIESEEDCQ